MNRESMIKVLRYKAEHIKTKIKSEFFVEVADTLQQLLSNDAISRKAVLDELDKHQYSELFCEKHYIDSSINLGMAHIVVNDLPPVQSKIKTGHWIDHPQGEQCSECGLYVIGRHNDYHCPYCGSYNRSEVVK